ncbi:hypothetical protein LSH36_114g06048 [Paralvinella palmiformis]|uniref:Uncharacterized protein n=1 Tax=Paralvinella palmiformis TaxID=53620 RepID=A0AAD9JZ63_9ANNE|nr:hypothetical protein LSH36_114g06048 [Paralvinella palmiformis]
MQGCNEFGGVSTGCRLFGNHKSHLKYKKAYINTPEYTLIKAGPLKQLLFSVG